MEEACVFCSYLLEGVTKLDQSLEQGSVSLRWSTEAMNLLKTTQVRLLPILKKCNLRIKYGAEDDWFDQYMKDTVALLDLCNSLKSAVSRIFRYRMVADLTIHELLRGANPSISIATNKKELEKVETEQENSLDVAMTKRTMGDDSIHIAMLAAKITIAAVSRILTCAIVSPTSVDMDSDAYGHRFPQLKPHVVAIEALVGRFKERSDSGPRDLFEQKMVDKAFGILKAEMVEGAIGDGDSFLSGVDLLRTRSAGLKEGIEMFDSAVDEVFDVVIRGRNEMLGICRDGALSTG